MAFYTDAAVESMVQCGIYGIYQMASGENCETEIN
jgi:D-lactate dehydrogenase